VSVGAVDDVEKIRNAVKGKRSKYPQLEKPLVVAVLSMSTFAGLRDFAQALVGSHAIEYTVPPRKPSRWVRLRNGAWMSQRGPSQRISAALTVADLAPSRITRALPVLWRNPWARVPLKAKLPLPEARIRDDGLVTYPEELGDPAQVMGLDRGWPGFEEQP
jgi:hypothetical protein